MGGENDQRGPLRDAGVDTVILDEVHAVAGTKRGVHLALSLARLDALLEAPAQRIGLSATVEPVQEVAAFLTGSGWAADGAHRELDLRGDDSVRVRQVRLHTDLRED